MSEKLLIETSPLETRLALLKDGVLEGFYVFPTASHLMPGAPVMGRIKSVVPALEAAFVDIGLADDAFLPLSKSALANNAEGDLVLASLAHLGTTSRSGEKGARLSRESSLAGRGFVLLVGGRGVHYSRQLGEDEKARLKELTARLDLDRDRFGLIVRTEAGKLQDGALVDEFEALWSEAEKLLAHSTSATKPGALFERHANLALFIRGLSPAPSVIEINDPQLAESLAANWKDVRCDLVDALTVRISTGLLEEAGVDEAVEGLLTGRVNLPSGGEIVVEPTEALTAVDVNTGAITRNKGATGNRASRALATNLEAVEAIARVLRVANIGGLVVIDFLKMNDRGDTQKVLDHLRAATLGDGASVRIGAVSKLGLCDLSRARRGPSLFDLLTEDTGRFQLRLDVIAAKAVRLAMSAAAASPGQAVLCEVAPQVLERIEDLRAGSGFDKVSAAEALVRYVARPDFARERIETRIDV